MAHVMIEVQDLTKHFGYVQALRGVSFEVSRGQVVGLLGPNGAGKTTAMRILTGFLAPTSGAARVGGLDVVEEPMACRRLIGYLPEGNPLYTELRIEEALAFAARMHGLSGSAAAAAVQESLGTAGLEGWERRLIGTVSKGYKQRVGLAQALLHKPDILILDEPTSGLDPNQQEDMRQLIRQLGQEHTVIISTHILPEVEAVCDRVMIINQGVLVADESVEDIKKSARTGPRVVLVVRGEAAAAQSAVSALDFVADVETEAVLDDARYVRVRAALEEGFSREHLERLASAAAANGLALAELFTETASLEQIFAELTSGDAPVAAQASAIPAGEV